MGLKYSAVSRRHVLSTSAFSLTVGLAGCISGGGRDGLENADEFVFVIEAQDDPSDVELNWEPVASWIESETDVPTEVTTVPDANGAIGALATGQAHATYISGGPGWVGWNEHGFDTLAVEADENGDTHYVAAAYTRTDTDIESIRDAEGRDSAHTGDLKGAGMLIPVAYLADEGLVTFSESDDVTAIRDAVEEYFGNPIIGGGYVGALRTLSLGEADIAFGRNTTPEDFCSGESAEDWCLDLDEYRIVEEFTQVPSHPILASTTLSEADTDLLREAFLAMNETDGGREILTEIFDVAELKERSSEEHLGQYGSLISTLPGIEDHLVE